MTKSKILLMLSASLSVLVASSDLANTSSSVSPSEVAAMQKQIADLQKQLTSLVKQLNEVKAKTEQKSIPQTPIVAKAQTVSVPTTPKIVTQENEQEPKFDKGYIPLPGTTAALKVSGMIKLDMIRDTRAHTSEQSNVGRLPYTLQMRNPTQPNTPVSWKDHYNIHGKQSKLRIDMNVKNKSGSDVKAYVEGDFFGATQWGDSFPNGASSNNGAQSSNTYTFRLRHAIFEYAGLEIGHTTTTFHLEEAILPSVDLNGINGGYGRHALIRYTHKLGGFSISAAAEQARADYITYTPNPAANTTPHYIYNYEDSAGNLAKQERPDLIVKVKYNFANGNAFGLGIINRDLRVKNNALIGNNAATTVDGKSYILNAWGLNLAAKIMTFGQSYFTGGVTTGQGLGWYILDAHGRSALFDPTASEGNRYKLVGMNIFWAGYCHCWCPQWQTNIGIAKVTLGTQGFSNGRRITQWFEPGLDKTYNKFLINTMYMPEENMQFGLEYFVLERKSTLGYTGLGHRLQFGASYKF